MVWKIFDRPGYFGKSREEIHEKYNVQFGEEENWRIAWQWGDKIIQNRMHY